jgi:hypothetical protein
MKHRVLAALTLLCLGAVLLLSGSHGQAQVVPAPTSVPAAFGMSRSERLGITFINSAQIHASEARYLNALQLGAGWNRYPVYWDKIERAPGQFTWSEYDRLVIADTRHRLRANAILIGIPSFHRNGSVPAGLNEPIFAHGGDFPRAGDNPINPANPWANFVYQAVQRYKPGGTLAQQQGWRGEEGVRVWEIWNEPDFPQFWSGGINAYARLLKTAYIVIKLADPDAQVMFGGLLFPTEENWLARVLAIFINDPFAAQNNFYFDIVAVHSYTDPWRSGWLVLYVRQTLIAYQLRKPIWLNESGVSVWDDYPGPTWARTADERRNLATADQQAWYFVQSSAYAWSEGADVVFFHQLYDDCGDQPAGTNFPPHDGSLCLGGRAVLGQRLRHLSQRANVDLLQPIAPTRDAAPHRQRLPLGGAGVRRGAVHAAGQGRAHRRWHHADPLQPPAHRRARHRLVESNAGSQDHRPARGRQQRPALHAVRQLAHHARRERNLHADAGRRPARQRQRLDRRAARRHWRAAPHLD